MVMIEKAKFLYGHGSSFDVDHQFFVMQITGNFPIFAPS